MEEIIITIKGVGRVMVCGMSDLYDKELVFRDRRYKTGYRIKKWLDLTQIQMKRVFGIREKTNVIGVKVDKK